MYLNCPCRELLVRGLRFFVTLLVFCGIIFSCTYGKSETRYDKFLARRIQIHLVYFCGIHFDLFFQNNFLNNA